MHRSYGVTLWFPSYVAQVTDAQVTSRFRSFCHQGARVDATLTDYCGCEGATFSGQHFSNMDFNSFKLSDSIFHNVTFTNATFSDLSLEKCNFTGCVLDNVTFVSRCSFNHVHFNQTTFSHVNASGLSVCNNGSVTELVGRRGGGSGESGDGGIRELVAVLESKNTSCEDVKCEESEKSGNIYRDLFLVSGSAFPGNIASAIAVYFLRRNYWLGKWEI